MTISASLVKELREKSGAGMMDCKKALAETAGDLEKASEWLRKKGLAAASKKAGRIASEGFVGISDDAVLFELNSETDFVAKNEGFRTLANQIKDTASTFNGNLQAFCDGKLKGSDLSVQEAITNAVATIGENIQLRRMDKVPATDGVVATYVHGAVMPGIGKIAVGVALKTNGDKAAVLELGKKIAMHIAAQRPAALNIDSLDPAVVDKEREILKAQALASGKPEAVVDKMIEGRIRKFYEEIVLLEQPFIIDGKTKVHEYIAQTAKQLGCDIELTAYVRYELGEGIEKKIENLADEVAALTGKK